MMKRIRILILAMLVCVLFAGCCMEHQWSDATCTAPKTCGKCGETEGEPLSHTWEDATCQTAKTCIVCGTVEGGLGEHDWIDATWTEPKLCALCGATEGTPRNYFDTNGLVVEENMPEELETGIILYDPDNSKNQEVAEFTVTPYHYTNAKGRRHDGRIYFVAEFEGTYGHKTGGPKNLQMSAYDVGLFDWYTGQMIPVHMKGDPRYVFTVDDQEIEVEFHLSARQISGAQSTAEDGARVCETTLIIDAWVEIPPDYDGLVLAIAKPKHFPYDDAEFMAFQRGGMVATDYAKYSDYYENVRFFRIVAPEIEE